MENRNKFFTSGESDEKWCSDTFTERYDHIMNVLNLYNTKNNKGKRGIDSADLIYIIKNAFVSKIYISKGAHKKISEATIDNWKWYSLYTKLEKKGVLDLQDKAYGDKLSPYFDFCKIGTKVSGLIIEHVVPGDVYIKDALNKVENNSFNVDAFKEIFEKVYICIVTSKENDILNEYRDKMPEDVNGNSIDYKENPFARYDELDIKIYKRGNNNQK